MKRYVTVGLAVVAGAALFEAALIPGVLIGGAAILAPKLLPNVRNQFRRRARSARATARRRTERAAVTPNRQGAEAPRAILPKFAIGQAVAKTITFRIIVTTLDFTTNYLVIGELGTAAGLSTFNLIAGPLFYLAHEAGWNYLGPAEADAGVPVLVLRPDAEARRAGWSRLTISRALAKTITFRTIASTVDFTTNYIVVGDVVSAVVLSASGFILGPFVYFGHEWVWDRFSSHNAPDLPATPKVLPAPA
jgi:uncharacterized membrane protein